MLGGVGHVAMHVEVPAVQVRFSVSVRFQYMLPA